jgi:hypothetical protein
VKWMGRPVLVSCLPGFPPIGANPGGFKVR